MAIQVNHIKGDIVELVFNPKEEDISVGENLSLREKGVEHGIIVQVVEFRTVSYPSLLMEQLKLTLEGESPFPLPLLQFAREEFYEMRNLMVAIAKIRKLTGLSWDGWNGWIPTRDVMVERTSDEEVFRNCISGNGNMLYLGRAMNDAAFYVEGQSLENVNIITGVKGSGKSHLAKAILLQLIERGAPCIVFDINREYINLPRHEVDLKTDKVLQRGIIHLQAGKNLKLSAYQFGLQPLLTMLNKFGLPEISYCPYLEICEPGKKAIEHQKSEKKPLPDRVLADIIARKIVAKRRKEKAVKAKAGRNLDELVADLNW